MGKRWTKCPRCRHLCRYEFAQDDDGDGLLGLFLVGPDCDYCNNKRSVRDCLATLAANLAIGALGCWGFHRGVMYGLASANVICSQDSPDEWYPGRVLDERPCRECGRRFVPTTEDFGYDWCGCEGGCGRSAP